MFLLFSCSEPPANLTLTGLHYLRVCHHHRRHRHGRCPLHKRRGLDHFWVLHHGRVPCLHDRSPGRLDHLDQRYDDRGRRDPGHFHRHERGYAFLRCRSIWHRLGPGLLYRRVQPCWLRFELRFEPCLWLWQDQRHHYRHGLHPGRDRWCFPRWCWLRRRGPGCSRCLCSVKGQARQRYPVPPPYIHQTASAALSSSWFTSHSHTTSRCGAEEPQCTIPFLTILTNKHKHLRWSWLIFWEQNYNSGRNSE